MVASGDIDTDAAVPNIEKPGSSSSPCSRPQLQQPSPIERPLAHVIRSAGPLKYPSNSLSHVYPLGSLVTISAVGYPFNTRRPAVLM